MVEREAIPAVWLVCAATHATHDADVGRLLRLEHRALVRDCPAECTPALAAIRLGVLLLRVVVCFALCGLLCGEDACDAREDDRLVVLTYNVDTNSCHRLLVQWKRERGRENVHRCHLL